MSLKQLLLKTRSANKPVRRVRLWRRSLVLGVLNMFNSPAAEAARSQTPARTRKVFIAVVAVQQNYQNKLKENETAAVRQSWCVKKSTRGWTDQNNKT